MFRTVIIREKANVCSEYERENGHDTVASGKRVGLGPPTSLGMTNASGRHSERLRSRSRRIFFISLCKCERNGGDRMEAWKEDMGQVDGSNARWAHYWARRYRWALEDRGDLDYDDLVYRRQPRLYA